MHEEKAPVEERGIASARRGKVAWVLSGGGAFGAIQVGQAQALLEGGIVPDLIVGCSVGAINGSFVAVDPDPARLARMAATWERLKAGDVFPTRSPRALVNLVGGRDHLCDPAGLRQLVEQACPAPDLAELAVPFVAVTTNLDTGAPAWFSAGDPRPAITASASVPGLFPPVVIHGQRHVDGGVLTPVPVRRAQQLGASEIWVLDVSARGRLAGARRGPLGVVLESFEVARYGRPAPRVASGRRMAVLPVPELTGLSPWDFRATTRLIDEAYRETAAWLGELHVWREACGGRPGTLVRRRPLATRRSRPHDLRVSAR
jgi:NTE family protein